MASAISLCRFLALKPAVCSKYIWQVSLGLLPLYLIYGYRERRWFVPEFLSPGHLLEFHASSEFQQSRRSAAPCKQVYHPPLKQGSMGLTELLDKREEEEIYGRKL
jgi:hypothetical protein